ncbi:hypothetical protein TWF225_006156 [Orbilia oligospora]|nr:hypothetical protein TWF225_006156 [Orbilia oligospora]KAF3247560.1 hypothetical protein TWF128_008631 [Orbilia oligospora]KAF3250811.1 hypothetical protein TWF217_008427 [Orbilia oligospora]
MNIQAFQMSILSLPVEIQTEILLNIRWPDHFTASKVCPLWASILRAKEFRERRYYTKNDFRYYHKLPIYDSLTPYLPRASEPGGYVYSDDIIPCQNVLLQYCVLVAQFRPGRESTVFLRVLPRCNSNATELQNLLQWPHDHRDLITKYALKDMANYHRSISSLITYDLIDITNSPLLSWDTTIFSETSRGLNNDISAGVHHSPCLLEFLYKFWKVTRYGYQRTAHHLSTRSAANRYEGGFERENWYGFGKTFQDLLEAVKARVEVDILPDPAVISCWSMVTDYLWYETSSAGIIVVHVEILVEKP